VNRTDLFCCKNRTVMAGIVFGVVFLQLAVSVFFMSYEKKDYYADDIYSYGSANSNAVLSPLSDDNDIITKIYTWQDSVTVRNYLTVSREEAFNFDYIKKIMCKEAHPPLYFYLLHFICSFVPYTFSKWSGFLINIIGFVCMQIYLYRFVVLISLSREKALAVMSFFGFTSATINMMCFLRMYMLSVGIGMIYIFYLVKYIYNCLYDNKKTEKGLIMVFFALIAGALTDYLFIIFAFIMSLCMCAVLFLKRKYGKMMCLIATGMFAVILAALCFPQVIDQIKKPQQAVAGATMYPFKLQLRMAVHVISNGLFGINTPILPTMFPYYLLWTVSGVTILYLLAMFIFRHDEWFYYIRVFLRERLKRIPLIIKKNYYTTIPLSITIVTLLFIFSRRFLIFYYDYWSIRYLYIMAPIITVICLLLIFFVLRNRWIIYGTIFFLLCMSLARGSRCFLMNEDVRGGSVFEAVENADVILVEAVPEMFFYHTADLLESRSFLYTTPAKLEDPEQIREILKKNGTGDKLVLIADKNIISDSMEKKEIRLFSHNAAKEVGPENNNIINLFRENEEFKNSEFCCETQTAYVYRLK